jgi:Ca2+-binding RTX toxin-like protein
MPFHIPLPNPTTPRPTSGNDIIDGTNGNDVLEAYIGNDLLRAGAGNDTLVASVGNHTLEGGLGDDQYVLTSSASTYLINDVGGTDTIDFAPYELKGAYRVGAGGTADPSGNDLYLIFSTFNVTVRNYFVTGENGGHVEALKFNSFSPFEESVIWQMGDVLNALQQSWPSMEDEFLYADPTGLPTYLDGGAGNDYLHSYFANDTLVGGSGNDTLRGSRGDNVLKGGTGSDVYWLDSWGGQDVVSDQGGIDTVNFTDIVSKFERQGLDLIITSTHATKLTIKGYFSESESEPGSEPSGGLIEHLWIQGYEKEWEGYEGPHGWEYHDWTRAEIMAVATVIDPSEPDPVPPPVILAPANEQQNADGSQPNVAEVPVIDGPCPPAPSIVAGKTGKDLLSGSAAADVFQFASAKMAGLRKSSDMILNFQAGVDTIDLSGIDANTRVAGDNAFKALLTGKKPFSKAGQLHYDKKTGILSGNTDKDSAAEFQIHLKNKPKMLDLGDFVL